MSKEVTVEEGNLVVAKFMGAEDETGYMQASTIGKTKVPTGRLWMKERFPSNIHLCRLDDLKYHTSWDWLMPVVEKIAKYGAWNLRPQFATLKSFEVEGAIFSTSQMDWEREDDEPVEWIFMVHHIVVQFILWHNQQNQKP